MYSFEAWEFFPCVNLKGKPQFKMITVPSVNILCIRIFFVIATLEFMYQQGTVHLRGSPIKGFSPAHKKNNTLTKWLWLFFWSFLGSSKGEIYSTCCRCKANAFVGWFLFSGAGGEECLGFALAFKTWCNDHWNHWFKYTVRWVSEQNFRMRIHITFKKTICYSVH